MISRQDEFKLLRQEALDSGDVQKLRAYAAKYAKHLLDLSDEDLLEFSKKAPEWK
jgi:hypothetical protein